MPYSTSKGVGKGFGKGKHNPFAQLVAQEVELQKRIQLASKHVTDTQQAELAQAEAAAAAEALKEEAAAADAAAAAAAALDLAAKRKEDIAAAERAKHQG